MFGYFGKGTIAPAPGITPPITGKVDCGPIPLAPCPGGGPRTCVPKQPGAKKGTWTCEGMDAVKAAAPTEPTLKTQPTTSTKPTNVQSQLDLLRQMIAEKRAEKMSEIEALHEKQAKQAAYMTGAASAGPRSESEVAIGVSTGYYQGYNHQFGDVTQMELVTQEVKKATDLVKALTEDVKTGSASRSELARAMANLNRKVKDAKKISQLQGFGETKSHKPLLILAAVGLAIYLLNR